jgi:hypothetical protein
MSTYGPKIVDILAKTGTTGGVPVGTQLNAIVGLNANKIPAVDGADAKGVVIYTGRHLDEPLEVVFTRNAQDGTFYLEGSLDGTNFSRLAFRRLDDDTVVPALAMSASTRVIVKLPQPGAWNRLAAVRCGFFLAADDADAQIVVRHVEGR